MATTEEREAAEHALKDEKLGPMSMIKGGVCKSNEFGNDSITVYIREQTGLLRDRTAEVNSCLIERTKLDIDQIRETFTEIARRWDIESPFSSHPAGKDRYLGNWLRDSFDLDRKAAKKYVDLWVKNRNVVQEPHPNIRRAMGLRRRETPDV